MPPGGAPATVHPIIDAENGQLFGAAVKDRWLPPDSAVQHIEAGAPFQLYQLQERGSEVQVAAPKPAPEFCRNPAVPLGAGEISEGIATDAPWAVLPRVPRLQDPNQDIYQDFVVQHLREKGIDEPAVEIAQLLRVDLDGDGTEEVLIVANRLGGDGTLAAPGDYAFVLMRKVVGATVRTISLDEEYYPDGCVAECAPSSFRIVAVLDLNGDGAMEIVVGKQYYEGATRSIYEIDDEEPRAVLSWTCGV